MSRYQIKVYDGACKNLLAVYTPPSDPNLVSRNKSLFRGIKYDFGSGVRNRQFEVRAQDPHSMYIEEGNWIEIHRLGEPVVRGRIKTLLPSDDISWLTVFSSGDGCQLFDFYTPSEWEYWEGRDIADILRDLMYDISCRSWTVQSQWEQCNLEDVQIFALDSEANSEDIILSKDENNAFKSSGTIISQVIEREGQEEWYVYQTKDIVSKETTIDYYLRSGNTPVPDDTWTSWEKLDRPIPTKSMWSINASGKYLQWKATQTTEDTESEGMEGSYGYSPVLNAVKLYKRSPIIGVEVGFMPDKFNIPATGLKPNKERYDEIIKKLCEKYGIKHIWTTDWITKTSLFSADVELGVDRSQESLGIIREGRDIISNKIQFNKKYANALHCYGAGEGADQLYLPIKNEEEIARRGGQVVWGVMVDTECRDSNVLESKANEALEKRIKGAYAFEISLSTQRYSKAGKLPFGAYDWLLIDLKSKGIFAKHQIIEMAVLEKDQEYFSIKLDNPLSSEREVLLNIKKRAYNEYYDQKNTILPKLPIQLRATGEYGYIYVSCVAEGEEFEWHKSNSGTEYKYLKTTKVSEMYDEQLPVGQKNWYKVRVKKNGVWSNLSGATSATVKSIPPDDIDRPKPSAPTALNVKSSITQYQGGPPIITNTITWSSPDVSQKITTVNFLRKNLSDNTITSFSSPEENGPYYDTDGLAPGNGYEYRVQYENEWKQKSDWYPADWPGKAITAASDAIAPAKPTGIYATPFFSTVSLKCNANSEPDLAGYEWRVGTGTDPNAALSMKGNGNTNSYKGLYGIAVNFWVRAYDENKNYSPWSDMATATPGKITKEDMTIFENGILTPEIITDVLNAYEIVVANAYTLGPQGILDSNGYVVLDPNGYNGREVLSGFLEAGMGVDFFELGKVTIPADRYWIGVASIADFGAIPGSNPAKEIKHIQHLDITPLVSFVDARVGGAVLGHTMLPAGSYPSVWVRIDHAAHANYYYTDGSNEFKSNYLRAFYKVEERVL